MSTAASAALSRLRVLLLLPPLLIGAVAAAPADTGDLDGFLDDHVALFAAGASSRFLVQSPASAVLGTSRDSGVAAVQAGKGQDEGGSGGGSGAAMGMGGGAQASASGMTHPAAASQSFCGDGTSSSSYMGGFVSVFSSERHSRPCVDFLFEGLSLDTAEKFTLGCWFTFCVGVIIEGILAVTRRVPWASYSAITAKLVLHGIAITLGYGLMLLVMSYSIEITLCAITGLCVGRLVFHGWLENWPATVASMAATGADADRRTACCTD